MRSIRSLFICVTAGALFSALFAEKGFIVAEGSKYVWSGTGRAFVPNFVMLGTNSGAKLGDWSEGDYDRFLTEMVDGHGFTGVHIPVFGQWFQINSFSINGRSSTDSRTFDKLEMMIRKTYARGAAVHIWMWGDRGRDQCPPNATSGSLSSAEKAVCDEMYNRLNDLPGWTVGYGFDLWEWTNEAHLKAWHDYCHSKPGWKHLMGARAGKHDVGQIYDGLDYSGYENHKPDYNTYRQLIKHLGHKPSFSEDRFRIRGRSKDVDPELSRKMHWWATMAGGVAGIWGNLGSEGGTSHAYPNKDLILCYNKFWHENERFLKSMDVDNGLTNGYCLITSDKTRAVFYKEGTSSIQMDLSGFNGSLTAVAVNAKKSYKEIAVSVSKSNMTWDAPNSSDWAIAVGDFGGGPVDPPDDTPPTTPSNLSATAEGTTTINLSWDEASDDESGISEYYIYRNGEKVGTADVTSYTDDGLTQGTTYKYRVSAVNGEGMEGEKSSEKSATTEADNDTSPPEPTSAIARSATSVKVEFNEPVTRESAENAGNYEISGGVTVNGAALQQDNTSVLLSTSTLTEKTAYTLTVSAITDRSPNANTGGGQVDFMLSGEIRISNLTVASGKAYEIVENIAEGDKQYIDRDYTFSSLGDYAGMSYIRTANDDTEASDEEFLSFDLSAAATLYVAYRHGSNLPHWLSSWTRTGDQVCGDGCSDVYEKDFEAGTVTLGGNRPGGAGNMYSVFMGSVGDVTIFGSYEVTRAHAPGPVHAHCRDNTLRISGLHRDRTYSIALTDARGRVSRWRKPAGPGGTVSFAVSMLPRGAYILRLQSAGHRCCLTTVLR